MIKQVFEVEAKVTIKIGGYNTSAFHLSWGNVALYDLLIKIGLCPAKSKIIPPLDIPDQFYFDFLRGEFDGDGCVRGFEDIRWANSHMFYVEFASASPTFITYLQANNTRLRGMTAGAIHAGKGAGTLSYAKSSMTLSVFMKLL